MSTPEHSGAGDTLSNALGIVRRRWAIILGVLLACVGVAVFKHARTARTYQASASVSFQSGTLSDAALQVSPSGSSEPQREADTEVLDRPLRRKSPRRSASSCA